MLLYKKNSILETKTQQHTIYIDKDGKQVTTNQHFLTDIDSKEIIQIGFYKNEQEQIQAVRMPKTVEKVPDQLPPEIKDVTGMFSLSSNFNKF